MKKKLWYLILFVEVYLCFRKNKGFTVLFFLFFFLPVSESGSSSSESLGPMSICPTAKELMKNFIILLQYFSPKKETLKNLLFQVDNFDSFLWFLRYGPQSRVYHDWLEGASDQCSFRSLNKFWWIKTKHRNVSFRFALVKNRAERIKNKKRTSNYELGVYLRLVEQIGETSWVFFIELVIEQPHCQNWK